MQDESREGVSQPLSDDELLERDYHQLEELSRLRKRAGRIGRTVTVRSVRQQERKEPYVYSIEREVRVGEPLLCLTLEEATEKVAQLEQRDPED
jgi:hypothetical protein